MVETCEGNDKPLSPYPARPIGGKNYAWNIIGRERAEPIVLKGRYGWAGRCLKNKVLKITGGYGRIIKHKEYFRPSMDQLFKKINGYGRERAEKYQPVHVSTSRAFPYSRRWTSLWSLVLESNWGIELASSITCLSH